MNETKTLCYEDGKTNPNVMKNLSKCSERNNNVKFFSAGKVELVQKMAARHPGSTR